MGCLDGSGLPHCGGLDAILDVMKRLVGYWN